MKHIKKLILTLGLAASTSLFLTGCSESEQASHGHDHDHDGDDHGTEHAAHDTDGDAHQSEGEDTDATKTAGAVGDVAGKVADVAAAIQLIEKPTKEQIAAAKPYKLETCIMSGEELGSMGDPIMLLVGDQQIKLCCDSCLDDLKADPAKALAKLSE